MPQTVEEQLVAVAPTPATTDVTFPLENVDEACKMLALKQSDLRQAKLVQQRLELYAAISGQTRDAEAASKAKQAYESAKAIVENILRELDTFRALRPPMTASDARSSTQNTPSVPRKNRGTNVDIHVSMQTRVDSVRNGLENLVEYLRVHTHVVNKT